MAVVELKAPIPLEIIPVIEELLAEYEEQRLMVLEDKPSARAWLGGYFESRDEAMAAWQKLLHGNDAAWAKAGPELRDLPDEDWKESYKAHFKAWKFGRLNWVPVWERERFILSAGEEVLWLDPGMAFGTGNHETTRLVVERLVNFAAKFGTNGRVIDAGCGSGILALSAVKLGFNRVAAFDNDPVSIDVSRENAEFNHLSGRVEFFVGDLVTGLAGREAELVLANIQADVLTKFSSQLSRAVAPKGALILSGILATELPQVKAVFATECAGWGIDARIMGEWSDLVLVRD
jgi:ribosomal protein L11 methyltransferase